ncbi:uncharacterized protein LOC110045082 isoform X2 [Orbicella faveolata]|uniref:uncharacterized protein LOC110045082 isoform X2 n=1 Tax=Orbicella faveolata TaxID=48498 RepID=UPI0009E40182|nr:uncharacterized protein LOC110045082 isoform X2 [Orbicella faveolata]
MEYYQYLKRDFEAGDQQHCNLMVHVGLQRDGYWCLSEEIQVHNCLLVPQEQREYRCADRRDLTLYHNTLEKKLLSEGYLCDVMRRFISLASCWGPNKVPFLAAAAFICQHLMKKGQTCDSADQANLGMVLSPVKSVGKSLSAKMLAFAQGVPGVKHNQLLAGGDQVLSGVSSKKLMEALTKTTFVVVIDDVRMSDSLSEFLLQVQGGLMQGSSQAGIDSPLGGVLLTSNVKENERLSGRVIHFVYKKDDNFSATKEQAIKELMDLVCSNRGLLTVWSMKYTDCLKTILHEGVVLGRLIDILIATIPGQQARWYKGVASVLLVHTMLYMSCGLLPEAEQLVELVEQYVGHYKECATAREQCVLEKLEQTIIQECKNQDARAKVKTWLNLTVKVNQNGTMVKGLAIKSSQLVNWPHIGRKELADEAKKHGQSVVNISVPFAPTMANENKFKKALKFPTSLFTQTMLNIVAKTCGDAEDNAEESNTQSTVAEQEASADEELQFNSPLHEDHLQSVKAVYLSLACDLPTLRISDFPDSDNESCDANDPPVATSLMTPTSKRAMNALTPRRRKAFEMGYTAGAKHRISLDSNETVAIEEDRATKAASEHSVSGCVGVRKTRKVTNDDACKLCMLSTPPGSKKKCSKQGIKWVQCDTCDDWFHLLCSGLNSMPKEDEDWECAKCKDRQ